MTDDSAGVPSGAAVNWAGNVRFSAHRWHAPSTVDELRKIVAGARRVHAVGARHSFSPVADGPVELVSLAGLEAEPTLDESAGTVTVSGGMRYGELAPWLQERGYALANLASLPHLTVVGAVATGTHGSGSANPSLAAAVRGLELVTAGGDLLRLTSDHPDLPGAVVALGALGIASAVTLAVEPTYDIAQYVYDGMPLAQLTDSSESFAAVLDAGYSVSAFTDWRSERLTQVWVKQRSGDVMPARWLGAVAADGPRHPVPGIPAGPCTPQFGEPGPWYARLPHFRLEFTPSSGAEIQSEYLLPIEHAPAALRALAGIREQIAPVLQVAEVRTVAADELWLSMAYRRPSVGLHFTWHPDGAAVDSVLRALEEVLAPYSPRPHWGKVFRSGPAELAPRYPRWADFVALRSGLDPTGTFGNDLIDRYFASTSPSD